MTDKLIQYFKLLTRQAGYRTDFNRMYADVLLVLLSGKKVVIPKRKR